MFLATTCPPTKNAIASRCCQGTMNQTWLTGRVYAVAGWLGCPAPGHGARHRTS
jgi:hypothetical protein